MKIHGDTNSGNCLKLKWVCDRPALPCASIGLDTLRRETRTAPFVKFNSAGQVPVVECDDGRGLESNTVIRYRPRQRQLLWRLSTGFSGGPWRNCKTRFAI